MHPRLGLVPLILLAASPALEARGQAAKPAPTRAVAIASTPPGAEVRLDAQDGASLGVTPIKSAKLTLGPHKLFFALRGYKTQALDVLIDAKSKKLELALSPVAYVQIRAAAAEAEGAEVSIDGAKLGAVPFDGEVAPGRHLFELKKEGFRSYSQWVELAGGQVFTLPLVLTSDKKPMGSLFVTADLPGVPVFVDGQDKGVTPMTIDLPPGQSLVEVRPKDLPVWKKQVTIVAGEKQILEANVRPEHAPSGTVMILSNINNTLVFINGTKTGTAPVTVENLPGGTHVVEGKSQGYQTAQATVRVTPGEQTVIKLELKPVEAEYGRMSVRASVPGAVVFIDGGERGPAPVEADKVTPGPHSIVVRAKGYQDFEGSCEVLRNDTCSVMAVLTALAPVSVKANVPNASLSVDGKDLGPLPYEGTLTAGTHKLSVTAPGRLPWERSIDLAASAEPRLIEVKLETGEPDEAEVAAKAEEEFQHASAITALPMGPGHSSISVAFSYPYVVEAIGAVGVVPGVAGGVSIRVLERDVSLAAMEIALHFYAGFRPLKPLSFGAEVEGYLGTNFDDINTRGLSVNAKGSLHFGDRGAFTLRVGTDVVRDGWDPSAGVSVPADTAQVAGRFRIGASVLIWASDHFGIHAGLDKVVGDDRLLLAKTLFGAIKNDPQLYFHVGVTFGN